MVAQYNPSTREVETETSQVEGQPGLHSKTLPQKKIFFSAVPGWLIPVILATQEAEIRRIIVQSQPRQIVCKTLY
jgi:hypothetical protein